MTLAFDRNTQDWHTSSEELRDALNDYRRNSLRARYREATALTPADTTDLTHRTQLDDLVQQADRRHNERHAHALDEALRSRESQEERQTTSPMQVMGMRKWEGRVIEVDDDYFSVELTPFDGGVVVLADFARDQIPEEDQVHPGDVVYVTARTVQDRGGRSSTSSIRLRRLGKWTEAEIAEQKRSAKELAAELASHIE